MLGRMQIVHPYQTAKQDAALFHWLAQLLRCLITAVAQTIIRFV
uniref:Phage tail fiber repeat family protein n=1 Tax=Escherichia coli TaxID=562 RepID=A0A168L9D4_ECOLX|nr:phage tail fiber repeat family protein [Escherichia coli]